MKKYVLFLSLFISCLSTFSNTFNIANGDVAALIAAINTANTNGEADIINLFPNGSYILNTVNYSNNSESEGQRGLPNILNNVSGLDLTINGNGATIQRNTSAPEFGFFSCTGHTVFNNIIFRNARVNARGAAIFVQFKGNIEVNNCFFYDNTSLLSTGEGGGGGIYTKSLSVLTVTNSYFENNTAVGQGGAISNLLSNMTLVSNTFRNNRTTRLTGAAAGGAVYSDGARGDNGALIIRNNLFENNSSNSGGEGGGMFLYPYRNESVEITGCTFKSNSAQQAGGYWHRGGALSQEQIDERNLDDPEYPFTAGPENTTLTLNSCIFDGNISGSQAGGLWLSACIINEIYNCTFKNNIAIGSGLGAGIFLFETNRAFTIRNCTFNNNTANQGGGISAGSITTRLTIQNCTFSANIANEYGGAVVVPRNEAPIDIINCTFANNRANNPGNGQSGAIHSGDNSNHSTNSTVMIKNNIFYNQISTIDIWNNCNMRLNDGGNNLFFPGNNSEVCVATSANSLFVDPQLGPLSDNGGVTQTMALLAGSPTINRGSGCPAFDQRGATRIGNCDIGAYEYGGELSIDDIEGNKNKLIVYPNPSVGEFFVKLPLEYEAKKGKMQVFALDGKLILEKNLNESETNIIKLTEKGMYILKITIEIQIFNNKILIH